MRTAVLSRWCGLSARKSSCFLLSTFVLAWGENYQIFYSYIKKKAPTNILRVFLCKLCVKTIPLVAQILGNSFKEKTRIKLEGCWMTMVGDQTIVLRSSLDGAILFSVTSHGLQ